MLFLGSSAEFILTYLFDGDVIESLIIMRLSKRQVAISFVTILLLGVVYWIVSAQYQIYRTVTYTIPAGTEANQEVVDIPAVIELTVGVKDILIIDNQDDVLHTFGPFVVAPHTKFTQRFDQPMTFQGVCSVHPDTGLTLIVHPAPWYIF